MSVAASIASSPSDGGPSQRMQSSISQHLQAVSSWQDDLSDPDTTDPMSGYSSQWSAKSAGQTLACEAEVRKLQSQLRLVVRGGHGSPNPLPNSLPNRPGDSDSEPSAETAWDTHSDGEYPVPLMLAKISQIHLSREIQDFLQRYRAPTPGSPSEESGERRPPKALDAWPDSDSTSNISSYYHPSPTQVTFAPRSPSADQNSYPPSFNDHST